MTTDQPQPLLRTSLAEQARTAADFVTRHTHASPYGPYRGIELATTILRVATLLGLDRTHVTAAPDELRRHQGPGGAILAKAICPATDEQYTLLNADPNYDDEPFHLVRPCPACDQAVPLVQLRTLGDLGRYLALPVPTDLAHLKHVRHLLSDLYEHDPAHTADCPRTPGL